MADPTPAEPTPAVATAAPAIEPAPAPAPVEAPKVEAAPVEPPKAQAQPEPAKAEPQKAEVKPDAPLFTLPEDFKPPESAVKKFADAMKAATVDGKFTVTPQQIVDMYVEQARDANAAWQAQIAQVNAQNEAACLERFSPQQLSAAQSAVGWASSFDPGFKDFARRQLNDPVFVNFMRVVGEAIGEDAMEGVGAKPPPPRRSAAQIMGYEKQ